MSIRIIHQLQKTKPGIYNTSVYEHSTEAGKGNTKRACCKVLYTIHGLVELKVDDKVEGQALTPPLNTGSYNEQANKGVSAVVKGRRKEGTRN